MITDLHISDFDYTLPDERIARYPLQERDGSKLLCCKRLAPGKFEIQDKHFRNVTEMIEPGSLLVCNNTKVVPARLHFVRESGAHIEIFCLEPDSPAEYVSNFASTALSLKCKCSPLLSTFFLKSNSNTFSLSFILQARNRPITL